MDFEIRNHPAAVEILFRGRVDEAVGVEARDAMVASYSDPSKRGVCIDLAQASGINSHGLGFLISLYKNACASGREFALIAPQPEVMSVLEQTKLSGVFRILGSADEFRRTVAAAD